MKKITRLKSERVQFRIRVVRTARSVASRIRDAIAAVLKALKEIFGPSDTQ